VISNGDVTRLSSYVLAVLKNTPEYADLHHYLMMAKAEVVARQLFNSYEDFLNLLKNKKF